MSLDQTWPEVEGLSPPLTCNWCDRAARWLADGTSACDLHFSTAFALADQKRRAKGVA